MDGAAVLGIAAVLALMALYEWPRLEPQQKNEKIAFASLTAAGGVLAVLLLYIPELPGPTELVDTLFKPLAAAIETLIKERSG